MEEDGEGKLLSLFITTSTLPSGRFDAPNQRLSAKAAFTSSLLPHLQAAQIKLNTNQGV